jgi:hypothetical protein
MVGHEMIFRYWLITAAPGSAEQPGGDNQPERLVGGF